MVLQFLSENCIPVFMYGYHSYVSFDGILRWIYSKNVGLRTVLKNQLDDGRVGIFQWSITKPEHDRYQLALS